MIGLLPLIAGIVLLTSTHLHTLGIVLSSIGVGILVVQVVFMATVLLVARRLGRKAKITLF
jgi:hypothetical protein